MVLKECEEGRTPSMLDNRWKALVTAERILLEEQFADCPV